MITIARRKFEAFLPMLWDWLQRGWMFLAGFLAVLLLFDTFFMVGINVTESLPQKVFLVLKQDHAMGRGDYVAFKWTGSRPYPKGSTFVKLVAGVGGDVVAENSREFSVNGVPVGMAKPAGSVGNMAGVPLALGPTGVIPQGMYYVRGLATNSLDSRYGLLGWVAHGQVVGRAIPLF